MSNTNHTPTPWRVDTFGGSRAGHRVVAPSIEIGAGINRATAVAVMHLRADASNRATVMADAAHIVKAVNAHDELVGALKLASDFLEANYRTEDMPDILRPVRAALAKVQS